MTSSIAINGIFLSVSAQETLKRWQESGNSIEKTDPERYVEYLNDTQDYLTRLMGEESNIGDIAKILSNLISIKDDLKLLIPKTQYQP